MDALNNYGSSSSDSSDPEETLVQTKGAQLRFDTRKGDAIRNGKRGGGSINTNPAKKTKRLPFPSFLGAPQDTDSPLPKDVDEMCRVRQFAHVRGNWATHVSLQIPVDSDFQAYIVDRIEALRQLPHLAGKPVHSFVSEENRVLHVSLSKTVALQHHEIDAFYAALAEKLRSVHAFTLSLQGLRHFTNENEHRSFLALCVADECHDYIRQHVLPCVDTVMRLFIKDVYYQNPSFHASVCWWASASPSPSTFKGDTGEHPERDMGAVAADARMAQRGGAVGRQTGVTQDTGRPTQASSVADTLSTERGTSMLTGMCGHTPVARDVPAAAGLEGVSGRDDVVKALADVDVSTGHVAQIALENFVIDTIYCKFGHTVREIKLSQ